jgi:ABC-type transporter Mla subunit MlaD
VFNKNIDWQKVLKLEERAINRENREERERELNDILENLNSVYDILADMSFKSEKIYNRLNAIEESILEILNKYN